MKLRNAITALLLICFSLGCTQSSSPGSPQASRAATDEERTYIQHNTSSIAEEVKESLSLSITEVVKESLSLSLSTYVLCGTGDVKLVAKGGKLPYQFSIDKEGNGHKAALDKNSGLFRVVSHGDSAVQFRVTDSDGKSSYSQLTLLKKDQSLDNTFGECGSFVMPVSDITQQSGGKMPYLEELAVDSKNRIIIAASQHNYWGEAKSFEFARILPSGKLDPSFGNLGLTKVSLSFTDYSINRIKGIAFDISEKIIPLFKSQGNVVSYGSINFCSLSADGMWNEHFGNFRGIFTPNWRMAYDNIQYVSQHDLSDTQFVAFNFEYLFGLLKMDSSGIIDPKFGSAGYLEISDLKATFGAKTTAYSVLSSRLLDSGQIVIVGKYTVRKDGSNDLDHDILWIMKLNTDGSRVVDFGVNGLLQLSQSDFVERAVVKSDGRILLLRNTTTNGIQFEKMDSTLTLNELTSEGSKNKQFGNSGSISINYKTPYFPRIFLETDLVGRSYLTVQYENELMPNDKENTIFRFSSVGKLESSKHLPASWGRIFKSLPLQDGSVLFGTGEIWGQLNSAPILRKVSL